MYSMLFVGCLKFVIKMIIIKKLFDHKSAHFLNNDNLLIILITLNESRKKLKINSRCRMSILEYNLREEKWWKAQSWRSGAQVAAEWTSVRESHRLMSMQRVLRPGWPDQCIAQRTARSWCHQCPPYTYKHTWMHKYKHMAHHMSFPPLVEHS